jgi:hypothetical protein
MKIDDVVTFLVVPFSGVKPCNLDPYEEGRRFGRIFFIRFFALLQSWNFRGMLKNF